IHKAPPPLPTPMRPGVYAPSSPDDAPLSPYSPWQGPPAREWLCAAQKPTQESSSTAQQLCHPVRCRALSTRLSAQQRHAYPLLSLPFSLPTSSCGATLPHSETEGGRGAGGGAEEAACAMGRTTSMTPDSLA